jgi:hypothetical protein
MKYALELTSDTILFQACISWGFHELLKVSLRPAIPYHSTPCRRYPWNILWPFQGWLPVGSLQSSYYPLDNPCHTPGSYPSYVSRHPDSLVFQLDFVNNHGRMARGGHGLPKVWLGPTMPNPSMPCGPAAVFYPLDTPCRTPMLFCFLVMTVITWRTIHCRNFVWLFLLHS